jgi:hypothetical protein
MILAHDGSCASCWSAIDADTVIVSNASRSWAVRQDSIAYVDCPVCAYHRLCGVRGWSSGTRLHDVTSVGADKWRGDRHKGVGRAARTSSLLWERPGAVTALRTLHPAKSSH